jgi:hypothetical protein
MFQRSYSEVGQAIGAVALLIMAIALTFFPRQTVESIRRRVPPNGKRFIYPAGYARFVYSRAYVPFTRFVGLGLFLICWILILHCGIDPARITPP